MSLKEKRFNNTIGQEYDLFRLAVPHHDVFQKAVGDILSAHFKGVSETLSVVEAGVGTGITSKILLDLKLPLVLIGVDNEPAILDIAKQALAPWKDRIHFIHQDILTFLKDSLDNSFDAFVSVWAIHNLSPVNRKRLFREVYRVLKPGGILINGDKYARNSNLLHSIDLANQLKQFDLFEDIGRPDLKKDWMKHYLDDEKIKMSETEQEDILRKVNFEDVEFSFRNDMDIICFARKPKKKR